MGCERSEDHHYHGDSRWRDDCGCNEYYDSNYGAWVPADEWTYVDLEGWGYHGNGTPSSSSNSDGQNVASQSVIMFDNDTAHDWQVEVGGNTYMIPANSGRDVPVNGQSYVRYMVNGYWTGPSGSSSPGSSYRLYVDGSGYESVN